MWPYRRAVIQRASLSSRLHRVQHQFILSWERQKVMLGHVDLPSWYNGDIRVLAGSAIWAARERFPSIWDARKIRRCERPQVAAIYQAEPYAGIHPSNTGRYQWFYLSENSLFSPCPNRDPCSNIFIREWVWNGSLSSQIDLPSPSHFGWT